MMAVSSISFDNAIMIYYVDNDPSGRTLFKSAGPESLKMIVSINRYYESDTIVTIEGAMKSKCQERVRL